MTFAIRRPRGANGTFGPAIGTLGRHSPNWSANYMRRRREGLVQRDVRRPVQSPSRGGYESPYNFGASNWSARVLRKDMVAGTDSSYKPCLRVIYGVHVCT